MFGYSVEKGVFLYESNEKCGSARKCLRKFRRKFAGIRVPHTADMFECLRKSTVLTRICIKRLLKALCIYLRKT
jgi:hypothetical protein